MASKYSSGTLLVPLGAVLFAIAEIIDLSVTVQESSAAKAPDTGSVPVAQKSKSKVRSSSKEFPPMVGLPEPSTTGYSNSQY